MEKCTVTKPTIFVQNLNYVIEYLPNRTSDKEGELEYNLLVY